MPVSKTRTEVLKVRRLAGDPWTLSTEAVTSSWRKKRSWKAGRRGEGAVERELKGEEHEMAWAEMQSDGLS